MIHTFYSLGNWLTVLKSVPFLKENESLRCYLRLYPCLTPLPMCICPFIDIYCTAKEINHRNWRTNWEQKDMHKRELGIILKYRGTILSLNCAAMTKQQHKKEKIK